MTGSVMLKNWKWVEKVLPGLLESQNWFPGFFWAREPVPRPLPVQELVPRPLSSPGTGSKASFKPLVWKKTTCVKVWAPHTKDGGPLGIRDISMMSFDVDELCKRVSQKHKHAAHLTVSTWKSWWSKLNLSLYCQISPIKPLLHLDPNVRIKWRWTGYTCIFVCYSCVLSGSGNWNKEFPFLYQDFIINLFVLNFHCIKVIKGTMS